MNVQLLKEEDTGSWDAFVMDSPNSSCYHLSPWKRVIEKTFGHRTYYIYAEESGIKGILPLVRLKSIFFGNFMISLPYFNYGGICADDDRVRGALLEKAKELARSEGADYIEMRHSSNVLKDLPVKTAKVSMTLALPGGVEELKKTFPSKLRSQIKRPEKEGMYAKIGSADELESFYRVFAMNMRDLGTPVYPIGFFRTILEEFPSSARICTVYTREGEPAASGFLLGFKNTVEIPWASSVRKFNSFAPNMLLYWGSLKFACDSGYSVFDFGRSTPGEGTYRFKEQWGAHPVQLFWHYWLKDSVVMPELNPGNPKYKLAINIWKRFPVSFTNLIGPHIVKFLP